MSYCSENKLPISTSMNRLIEVIELLGFLRAYDPLKIENRIASYLWLGDEERISFVGVELSVYKEKDYISVQTRTRVGRSFWDLEQQNKTISLLRSLFGGTFTTDEGNNRYMKFDDVAAPSKIACSLFKSRWIFNNAMIKPQMYLQSRKLNGDIARENLTGMYWLDDMNPRILSNNMIIPYIIGCWESYFRNSYVSILKYSDSIPEKALKNCRVTNADLLHVIRQKDDLSFVLADSLSFQRPGIIAENFRLLNGKIDIASWLRKPYHRRKTTLYESINKLIDLRDSLVHAGNISHEITDKRIKQIIDDLTAAADRAYKGFGDVYGFQPSYHF